MRSTLLGSLGLVTVIGYVQRLALSAPTKDIERDLQIGPAEMGVVMGAWYWGYALFQLPSGWVADRIGSKTALIVFCVAWSACTALAGQATRFEELAALWALMGCAQAGLFPCATKAIGAAFKADQQAFASGILACTMAMGAAVAQRLTPQLLGMFTWQQILVVYAVPGLVWAVAFALLVKRPDPPAPPAANRPRLKWSKLVTDRQMQILCLQQFLRAAAIAFFYTWFPRYLQETKGVSVQEAGNFASWPPFAGMFGGLLGGLFSDWVLRKTGSSRLARQGMACAAMIVCASTSVGAYFVTDIHNAVALLCVGAFCGMAGGVSGYAVAIAYGGKQVATVFATMNMWGNVGAALFPLVVGQLVAATGNWNLALFLFAGLFAVDAVCWAALNPKGTLFNDEEGKPCEA
jgi:MFS family permease